MASRLVAIVVSQTCPDMLHTQAGISASGDEVIKCRNRKKADVFRCLIVWRLEQPRLREVKLFGQEHTLVSDRTQTKPSSPDILTSALSTSEFCLSLPEEDILKLYIESIIFRKLLSGFGIK